MGGREVLGSAVGDSEDGAFWTPFLRSLKARGRGGTKLVISDDAHAGLKAVIAAVMLGAAWQRSSVNIGGGWMVPLVHLRRRERTLATCAQGGAHCGADEQPQLLPGPRWDSRLGTIELDIW